MLSKELSREELFALVWEKPPQEVARELGVSDVAIAKLCARPHGPKPRATEMRAQGSRSEPFSTVFCGATDVS